MSDIAPELLELIQRSFWDQYNKSPQIQRFLNLVKEGKGSYKGANEYAIEIGEMLSKSFTDILSSDILPDGRMYYNIAEKVIPTPMMENYRLVAGKCAEVQTAVNRRNGLGLKGIRPEVNEDRITGLVNLISDADNFDDVKDNLGEPVVNFTQSIVDEAIRTNAEFQYRSGLKPKILRRCDSKCCAWCEALAGLYDYPTPDEVFKRHRFCRCTVEFLKSGKSENVHTKLDTTKESRIQQLEDLEALDRRKLEEIRQKNQKMK